MISTTVNNSTPASRSFVDMMDLANLDGDIHDKIFVDQKGTLFVPVSDQAVHNNDMLRLMSVDARGFFNLCADPVWPISLAPQDTAVVIYNHSL